MGDNGVYRLENMTPKKINGQTILTPTYYSTQHISSSTANFTNLFSLDGMDRIRNDIIAIDNGFLFEFDPSTVGDSEGQIHYITGTGSGTDQISPCSQPDILTTKEGNAIYTSDNHLSIARRYTATGGSATTLVVSGVDFAALGYSSSTGKNKIWNNTTGEEYTISSAVGDTLTFSAGSETPATGDIFYAFKDDFQKFNTLANTNDQQFVGQLSNNYWVKQIKMINNEYWILNGNYISSLNVDESTWSATAKQLPEKTQATCFDGNGGKMLVGSDNGVNGSILLWDTYSDNWNSIIETSVPPNAIVSYKAGWIVIIGAEVYYTDGYRIKKMAQHPQLNDFDDSFKVHYNGVDVVEEDLFILSKGGNGWSNDKHGVYKWNQTDEWIFIPMRTNSNNTPMVFTHTGAMLATRYETATSLQLGLKYNIFASFIDDSSDKYITKIYDDADSTRNYSAMFYIKLPQKMKINAIELNLAPLYKQNGGMSITNDVTVSYGDDREVLWGYTYIGNGSDSNTIKNTTGSFRGNAEVGDQIRLLNGSYAGNRSWIDTITDGGTNNESWEISPAFTGTPTTSAIVNVMKLKKAETKTISNRIPDNLMFNVSNFYSDKLWIEVSFEPTGTPLDLHSINIY